MLTIERLGFRTFLYGQTVSGEQKNDEWLSDESATHVDPALRTA